MVMRNKNKKSVNCEVCGRCAFKIVDKNIIEIKCSKCGEYVYYEIKLPLTKGEKTDILIKK